MAFDGGRCVLCRAEWRAGGETETEIELQMGTM